MHREHFSPGKVHSMYAMGLLSGFSVALSIYFASEFFRLGWAAERVGVFYLISYGAVFVALLFFHKAILRWGRVPVVLFLLLANIIVLAFLAGLGITRTATIFLAAHLFLIPLLIAGMDVVLETFSSDNRSGRIRGIYLTLVNLGFIAGPFVAANLISRFGYPTLFTIILFFNICMLAFALVSFRRAPKESSRKRAVLDIVSLLRKRGDIARIYWISFTLDFFYAVMVVYAPLYLFSLGMSWVEIGAILSLVLVPFIFVQYPAGYLADTKWGEREMILAALAIISLSVCIISAVSSSSFAFWVLLLGITRIGAALLEVLRDSYFYKRVDATNVTLIDFFRTSYPLGYIASSLAALILLAFFPLQSVFIFLAAVVALGFIPAWFLEDNK